MLRDWTNSDKVDLMTSEAERFFIRLIMKADDYGCFWADVKRLKANLFPLKSDSIREADILRWMAECQKAELIVIYESDCKKYLQIIDFNQRLRTKKHQYPTPDGTKKTEASEDGYIYVLGSSNIDRKIKIGYSLNPWARVKEVSASTKKDLKVLFTFKGSLKEEHEIHKILTECRIEGEWFHVSDLVYSVFYEADEVLTGEKLIKQLRSYYAKLRSTEVEVEVEVEEKSNDAHSILNSNLFRKPVIPSKQQVLDAIIFAGGTKEMAKSFYEKYESVGWFLNGSPIVNYAALANRFVNNWKDNDKKEKPEQPIVLLKRL